MGCQERGEWMGYILCFTPPPPPSRLLLLPLPVLLNLPTWILHYWVKIVGRHAVHTVCQTIGKGESKEPIVHRGVFVFLNF